MRDFQYPATTETGFRHTPDNHDWRQQASCRLIGGETFYAPEQETIGQKARRERAARKICALCPVRVLCRNHALKNKEQHGIWGGLTASERRGLRYVRLTEGSDRPSPDRLATSSL